MTDPIIPLAPTVTLVSYATVDLGVTLQDLAAALQEYCTRYLLPTWGCTCTLQVLDPAPPAVQLDAALAGTIGLIISDDSDQAGALAYHLAGPDGWPRGFVFARTTLADGGTVGSDASHELAELLVDQACNCCVEGPANGQFTILEVCDPVESDAFLVKGVPMSNMVTPAWFDPAPPAGSTFDLLGTAPGPFQLAPGGYVSQWTARKGWTQSFADRSKEAKAKWKRKKKHPFSRVTRLTNPRE